MYVITHNLHPCYPLVKSNLSESDMDINTLWSSCTSCGCTKCPWIMNMPLYFYFSQCKFYPIQAEKELYNQFFLVCWPYSGHAPYRLPVFPFLDFGDWKAGGRQEKHFSCLLQISWKLPSVQCLFLLTY